MCERARVHVDPLSDGNPIQVALGDIDQNPNDLMVDDAEQHVARAGAHSVHRCALDDLAILRRQPWH